MNDVYLLLGSNIEPEKNIPLALQSLSESTLLEVVRISSVWQTKAVGKEAEDFLNVAVHIRTTCELNCLKQMVIGEIEKKLGRVRTTDKNAPRTIDLDVVVYNHLILDKDVFRQDHIILPMAEIHPRLHSNDQNRTLGEIYALRIKQTRAKKVVLSI